MEHKEPKKQKEKSKYDWKQIFPRYPSTYDGFLTSFKPDEKEKYLPVLEKYGFVIIETLNKAECEATVQELFAELNSLAHDSQKAKLDPNDPKTWENENWPNPNKKFLTSKPAFSQKAFDNRTHPKIHQTFTAIYGHEKLKCTIDNWGIYRGTKNLVFQTESNVEIQEKPEWRTSLSPHWDVNPWGYTAGLKKGEHRRYQGLVALRDCPEEVGGLLLLPGGVNFLPEWTSYCLPHSRTEEQAESFHLPSDDVLAQYLQRIPLRQGEYVIWDSGTLHATFPNKSHLMRLYQFIRLFPATSDTSYSPERVEKQFPQETKDWKNSIALTPLGRKLVGIDQWNQE